MEQVEQTEVSQKNCAQKPLEPLRPKYGRRWEYLNTFIFELPAYIRILYRCLTEGVRIFDILKVNWSLDHGGIGFASKYKINNLFRQSYFLPSILLKDAESQQVKLQKAEQFIDSLESLADDSFPIIAKPDHGRVGKAVTRIDTAKELKTVIETFQGDYLLEQFCSLPLEFSIFYYRHTTGDDGIFSITWKEFPSVLGDGNRTLDQLIRDTPRLKRFRPHLSNKIDLGSVPENGESVQLSYVGNHAQGAVFHDRTDLVTEQMLEALRDIVAPVEGFNYGRLDIKARSLEAFQNGEFTVIEVNGIDSLSVNIFDPHYKITDAYRILIQQYDLMIDLAKEHKERDVERFSVYTFWKRIFHAEQMLSLNQSRVASSKLR